MSIRMKRIDVHSSADTQQAKTQDNEFKPKIRWPDLIVQIVIHLGSLYGIYYLITFRAKFHTYLWCKLN